MKTKFLTAETWHPLFSMLTIGKYSMFNITFLVKHFNVFNGKMIK